MTFTELANLGLNLDTFDKNKKEFDNERTRDMTNRTGANTTRTRNDEMDTKPIPEQINFDFIKEKPEPVKHEEFRAKYTTHKKFERTNLNFDKKPKKKAYSLAEYKKKLDRLMNKKKYAKKAKE